MRYLLAAAALFLSQITFAHAQISRDGQIIVPAAHIVEVHKTCLQSECPFHDAVVFIHGVYGSAETFKNDRFNWPEKFPAIIAGRNIDVYRVDYSTVLWNWLKRDVSSMDEVAYSLFKAIYPDAGAGPQRLKPGRYRSVSFIAHSLGGNVVSAFLHTVKTELGHEDRARYGFVVTLGTPINGAQISTVAAIARRVALLPSDPMLASMAKDNTFLKMLNLWRRSENLKASRFRCRPVNLYVGVEGSDYLGIRVVPKDSAVPFFNNYAKEVEYFQFKNHSTIVKPDGENDPVYKWVNEIAEREMERLTGTQEPFCERNF